jgi:sarcosine oxidase subunit gamma
VGAGASTAAGASDAAAVDIGELDASIIWNLRGDASDPRLADKAQQCFGMPLPVRAGTSGWRNDAALWWTGPTSWLYVAARHADGDFDTVRTSLNGVGAALFDVSSSYAKWRVRGERAARVLNRGCPLDLHPRAFPPGGCAQTLLGHVTALLCRREEPGAFIVLVARSFADDVWTDLCGWAASEGCRTVAPSSLFDAAG